VTPPPAPGPLRARVHPLLSLHLSCRVSTAPNLPRTEVRSASLGVSLPIATPARGIHLRASIPGSLYGPPSTFLTSSTAYSSSNLAGLFHPAATSGIHLSGVLPRCPARNASSAPPYPPVVGDPRLPPGYPDDSSSGHPASRVLIRTAIRSPPAGCLVLPTPRSPLRFQLPRDFLRTPWRRLRATSAHDLGRQALRVILAAGLQRVDRCPTQYSVPRLLSRSSFPACLARPPR
jgi:hypothetical protein